MNVTVIAKDGVTYAKIFRADIDAEDGIRFITEDSDPLQVGVFEREAGYEVAPHKHNPRELSLPYPGECIWMQSGKANLQIFDEDWNMVKETIVKAGDCLVIVQGGHAMQMIEPVRFLEVKQGPYLGREDDKTFKPESV